MRVRVQGSEQRLHLVVENETPGVLRFLSGDLQEVVTGGGPQNFALLKVETIRAGDFSFHARLLPAPDPARRSTAIWPPPRCSRPTTCKGRSATSPAACPALPTIPRRFAGNSIGWPPIRRPAISARLLDAARAAL